MEEVVAKSVALRELAFRQVGRIDIAKDEARVVAPRDELVEIAQFRLELPVVDLQLLVIETVNDVAGFRVRRDIVCKIVGTQRERDDWVHPPAEIAIRARGKLWIGGERKAGERPRRFVNER